MSHPLAIDTRIEATVVSGYFQPREEVWKEPIYRDVWGLIREVGDAELAGMIAPRALIVEAAQGPEVSGRPPESEQRKAYACVNGKLTTPSLETVKKEVDRALLFFEGLKEQAKLKLISYEEGGGKPGSEQAIRALVRSLGFKRGLLPSGGAPKFS